ncbi:MAG TPA: penicillin-binding transpeptidase domain-containing protein [Clostridia bacterium]|nr:penicillin-binding transpeptidase domain-containing protein [Clostridia bacterium]
MKISDVLKNRYFILIIVLVICSIGLIVKLYDMQIVKGDEYALMSSKKVTHSFDIEAPRGLIYDANGRLLAYNRESNDLYMTKAYTEDDELNAGLLMLSEILKANGETYYKTLEKYMLKSPNVFNPDKTMEQIYEWQQNADLFDIQEKDLINNAKEFFVFLKDKFNVSDEYSYDEAFAIVTMRYEILINRWNYVTGGRIRIAEDVSLKTIGEISELRHLIKGIIVQKKMVREYGNVMDVAHVLGYIGRVTADELADREGYDSGDFIGKSGIELFYEDYLRGTNGHLMVETDTEGTILRRLSGMDEVPGNNLSLTIDMNLQRVAMDSLERTITQIRNRYDGDANFGDAHAGAAVVIEVSTGKVLAMASYPTYDPGWFIHNDTVSVAKRLDAMFDSYGTPMFNRAIQGRYTPGSTYKPIVAIAALEDENLDYDSESLVLCDGKWTYDEWTYWCYEYREFHWTHGAITISEGIETSCNLVFHKLGIATGIDNISKWAKAFGLDCKTGIDLNDEIPGIIADKEYKYSTFNERWWSADTGQSSIGQLYNSFTPIEMAVYAAALANGGKRLVPYIVDTITDDDGNIVYQAETIFEQIEWSEDTKKVISEGMSSVTLDGTASKVFDDYPINVAGKTGTAETGREADESSNGIFICYAPVENPQIAIVTVIENGVWGSYTAPVAKDILSAYFGIRGDLEWEKDYSTFITERERARLPHAPASQ